MNPLAFINHIRRAAREEFPFGRKFGNWYTIFSDFETLPIGTQAAPNDPQWDLTGTGTVPAPTFLATSAGRGGILLATRTASAADNDEAAIFPLATSRWGVSASGFGTNRVQEWLQGMVTSGASIAQTAFIFGYKLTDTGGDTSYA